MNVLASNCGMTICGLEGIPGPPGPGFLTVDTRTELAAVDAILHQTVLLREVNRKGLFTWREGNFSSEVSVDTQQGIYVAPTGQTGATGVWERVYQQPLLASWFGASPDVADNKSALQGLLDFVVAYGGHAHVDKPGRYVGQRLLIQNSTRQIGFSMDLNAWLVKRNYTDIDDNVLDIFTSENIALGNLNIDCRYSEIGGGGDGGHGLTIRDSSNITQTGRLRVRDWKDNCVLVYTNLTEDPPVYHDVTLDYVEGIAPTVTDDVGHVISGGLARNGILFEDMLRSGCRFAHIEGVLDPNPGYAVQFKNNCHQCWYGGYTVKQSFIALACAGNSGASQYDAVDCWFGPGSAIQVQSAIVISHARNVNVDHIQAGFHPDGVVRPDGIYPAFVQVSGICLDCHVKATINNYADTSLPPVYFASNNNSVEITRFNSDCDLPAYVKFTGHENSLVIWHDGSTEAIADLRDKIIDITDEGTNTVELHYPGKSWVVGSGDPAAVIPPALPAANALYQFRTNRIRVKQEAGVLLGDELADDTSDNGLVDVNSRSYAGSWDYEAPVTGFNKTLGGHVTHTLLKPAGPLASGTITMNAAPTNGLLVTISSTQTITALTLNPNTGQSIVGAVTTLTANAPVHYRYRAADATWYRA